MGNCNCNCIEFTRGISWVDDGEWDLSESEEETKDKSKPSSKQEETKQAETSTITTAPTEVRIKISKKQLEKLLEQVDSKDLPMQDLLAGLVKVGQPCKVVQMEKDQRFWRPALQSIPEVVEQ